jgi:hypothetical protein
LAGNLGRQPWLGRQLWPATLAGNFGRQLWPATLAGNFGRQLGPATWAGQGCQPFGVFWAEKFFVSEFDETLHIDAPFDGDHFIINKSFVR